MAIFSLPCPDEFLSSFKRSQFVRASIVVLIRSQEYCWKLLLDITFGYKNIFSNVVDSLKDDCCFVSFNKNTCYSVKSNRFVQGYS